VLEVNFEDLDFHFGQKSNDPALLEHIYKNTKRYIKMFYEAADKLMPQRMIELRDDEIEPIEEIFNNQRLQNQQNNPEESNMNHNRIGNSRVGIPSELTRR
jgi:hypothetical protein